MIVNHNLDAFAAWSVLRKNNDQLSKSIERLSTGLRINSASDDAAGLAVSEKMRSQIRGFAVARRNAQDAISMIQTAEGATNEIHAILQRMRELALQSASGTLTDTDRSYLQEEVLQLQAEIDRIASQTEFNTMTLLNGSFVTKLDTANSDLNEGQALGGSTSGVVSKIDVTNAAAGETFVFSDAGNGKVTLTAVNSGLSQTIDLSDMVTPGSDPANQTLSFNQLGVSVTITGVAAGNTAENIAAALDTQQLVTDPTGGAAVFQIGANSNQTISLSISAMDTVSLGIDTANLNIASREAAMTAIDLLDAAIDKVSSERAKMGAVQNRLESTISSLMVAEENAQASEARIRDADMAREMMEFTRLQILQQTGTAMLASANAAPQAILSLF